MVATSSLLARTAAGSCTPGALLRAVDGGVSNNPASVAWAAGGRLTLSAFLAEEDAAVGRVGRCIGDAAGVVTAEFAAAALAAALAATSLERLRCLSASLSLRAATLAAVDATVEPEYGLAFGRGGGLPNVPTSFRRLAPSPGDHPRHAGAGDQGCDQGCCDSLLPES